MNEVKLLEVRACHEETPEEKENLQEAWRQKWVDQMQELSPDALQQEIDRISMEQMRLSAYHESLTSEYNTRQQAQRQRRQRLLPTRHPEDTYAKEHCVTCGVLLALYDDCALDYDRHARGRLIKQYLPSQRLLDGVRCESCHEHLWNRILNMLEEDDESCNTK